jgi:TatD DNase family protein
VAILQRAQDAGVRSQTIVGGSLSESKEALELAKEHSVSTSISVTAPEPLTSFGYRTLCHHWMSFYAKFRDGQLSAGSGAEGYLATLDQVISEYLSGAGRVVAVGECGLGRFKFI